MALALHLINQCFHIAIQTKNKTRTNVQICKHKSPFFSIFFFKMHSCAPKYANRAAHTMHGAWYHDNNSNAI